MDPEVAFSNVVKAVIELLAPYKISFPVLEVTLDEFAAKIDIFNRFVTIDHHNALQVLSNYYNVDLSVLSDEDSRELQYYVDAAFSLLPASP